MAIKTSGPLALWGDIGSEFGTPASFIGLGAMSSLAGFTTPHAMSEFYGFSRTNNFWYYSGRQGWLGNNVRATGTDTLQFGATMMGWFKVNSVTKKDQFLFSMGRDDRSNRSSIRVYYYAALNRIQVALWDRSRIRRVRREYPLHDNPTGVSNSSSGWRRDQPGVLHSSGMVHIAATWDGSNDFSGLQLYWNGGILNTSVNNNSTTVNMGNEVGFEFLAYGNTHFNGTNASIFDGDMDNPIFFDYLISPTNIGNYYDAGNVFPDTVPFVGPGPFYAQGFEAGGDLQAQFFDRYNHNPQMQGSTYQFLNY